MYYNEEDFWRKYCGFNYLCGMAQSNKVEYKGETVYSLYEYNLKGKHRVKFRLIYSHLNEDRGISLSRVNFKGRVSYDKNDESFMKFTGAYACLEIFEPYWKDEKEVTINLKDGFVGISNGKFVTDKTGFRYLHCGLFWGAMKVEQISPTVTRFYCNDTEFEDDFDDLIFEMEVID